MRRGAAVELRRRREADPIAAKAWLPLQAEFLASEARVKQLRAGNQTIGKSTAAIAESIGRCLGRHPLTGEPAPHYVTPPIEWWTVCASWSQSLGIQAKIWDLLPKDELDPRTVYDRAAGFSPIKQPTIIFRNGSILRVKTAGQDTLDWAGATIAGAHFDEPPKDPRQYTEALMRLEELGGTLLLSYTPINAPVEYLRELVEAGQIEDHWRLLTPAELIPVGAVNPLRARDGRPKDAAWIAERAAKIPAHERDVVLHGAWEGRAQGAYFADVWRDVYAERAPVLAESGRWALRLGIDHGSRPGKQYAVLVLTRPAPGAGGARGGTEVLVWDEYGPEGTAGTTAEDARGILAALDRNGWTWAHLDSAEGDRVHMPGSDSQKSNEDLEEAIAHALGFGAEGGGPGGAGLRPRIEGAKRGDGRGAGAVGVGERWLYEALAARRLRVHPRCVRAARAFRRYIGGRDDAEKDVMDAIRYAVGPLVFGGGGAGARVRLG